MNVICSKHHHMEFGMKQITVIGLRLKNGDISPLAWTLKDISQRELKRATNKFRRDSDVVAPIIIDGLRLYKTIKDIKFSLPEYI